jgi:ubiquinone/menaquinone biosynthesis C-methylase UbiE
VGIDMSSKTVDLARGLHPQAQAEFRVGSLPNLPLRSASVDAALCLEVLEHVEDDRAAVRELRRVLRPKGLLIVSVPQTYYWTAYRCLIGHVRHYTARSLQDLLRQERFEFVDGLPQFLRTWRAYHYAYVAARGVEALARTATGRDMTLYDSRAYNRLTSTLLRALDACGTQATQGSTFVVARRGDE